MTDRSRQMYNEFQLVYNNLASNLAPGLDIFEISMYLTKAYHSYVVSAYHQYEKSEGARKSLIELVKPLQLSPYTIGNPNSVRISKDSTFFRLPDDVLYIVYEAIEMQNNREVPACLRGKTIQVSPTTHDEFHSVYNNPFRYNKRHALRLDIDVNPDRLAEIVSTDSHIKYYQIRYIKKPGPIILDNLTGTDKIDGIQTETLCELNPIYDKDIVKLAAQLAYQDYKAA